MTNKLSKTDIFKNVVNAPHRAFGKLFKKISDTHPLKHENNAVKAFGPTGKAIGWVLTGSLQFLLWLIARSALDNPILDKGSEKFSQMTVGKRKRNGKDKQIQKFMHKNPHVSAYILYYLLLGGLAFGGYSTYAIQKNKDDTKNRKEVKKAEQKTEQKTFSEYKQKLESITPFLIADLIFKEGVHTNKNGLHTPYRDSNGNPTIGLGSTVLKDGTAVTMNTPPITTQEAYDLACWHIEQKETFFLMYCYDITQENININTPGEALCIASIMYNAYNKIIENPSDKSNKNRFTTLRNDFKQHGDLIPDSLVRQRFIQYPITDMRSFGELWINGHSKEHIANSLGGFLLDGKGMIWRRWLEAGLLLGEIEPQMLLKCPANGGYEFFNYMGGKKSAFFIKDSQGKPQVNKETFDLFRKWVENPVNKQNQSLAHMPKVQDFLPESALSTCSNEACELNTNKENTNQDTIDLQSAINMTSQNVHNSDSLNAIGEKYLNNSDYKNAIKNFTSAIQGDKKCYIAYSNIILTHYKSEKYDDAIKFMAKLEKSQDFALMPDNIKSYTYYNIALCLEKKGDDSRSGARKRTYYEQAQTYLESAEQFSGKTYTQTKNRLQKSLQQTYNSTKTAYNRATKKIQNRTLIQKLVKQNITNDNKMS